MLQGGTFDRVSPRKHSVEPLKASAPTAGPRVANVADTPGMVIWMYVHTYSVHIGAVYTLFHNALNATGSTSEIIRSEECIRLCESPGKNGNGGQKYDRTGARGVFEQVHII